MSWFWITWHFDISSSLSTAPPQEKLWLTSSKSSRYIELCLVSLLNNGISMLKFDDLNDSLSCCRFWIYSSFCWSFLYVNNLVNQVHFYVLFINLPSLDKPIMPENNYKFTMRNRCLILLIILANSIYYNMCYCFAWNIYSKFNLFKQYLLLYEICFDFC